MESNQNNINNTSEKNTIVISNINRNLRSEDIYQILVNKIFPNEIVYNAIYTEHKKGKFKNSGKCYINFTKSGKIDVLKENIDYFKGKKKQCEIYESELQGDAFIQEMENRWSEDPSIDYIRFSNYSTG